MRKTAGGSGGYGLRVQHESPPGSAAADPVALRALTAGLERLDNRIRRWSTTRWRASGRGGRVREEVAYELAVTLAELARQAGNGAPPIAPPLLAAHGIADQLAVLGAELIGAPEAAACAEEATAAIERAAELL